MAMNPAKEHRGVLLGITNIDKPMRNLTPEERVAVARMCREAVTSKAAGAKNSPVELSNPGLISKTETGFMGIQVVIANDRLQLYCEEYMVSNQKLKELSAIVALRGTEGHLVIIGNCQKRNQRVAFVLDMFSDQQANEVIQAIQLARNKSIGPNMRPSIPPPQVPNYPKPTRKIPQTLPSRPPTFKESGRENSLNVYEPEPGTTSFPLSSIPDPTSLLSPHLNFGTPMFTNSREGSPKTLSKTAGIAQQLPGHSDASATVSIPPGVTLSIPKTPEVATHVTSPELHTFDVSLTSNHSNNTSLSGQCEAAMPQSYTPVFVSNPFNSTSLSIRPNSKLLLANSSTGTTLANKPAQPRVMVSGLPYPMYTKDENSTQRVSNTSSSVTATSNNTPQHTWQPTFPADMKQRSGSNIPHTDVSNSESSSQGMQENNENDVSLVQVLPNNQSENFDENPYYVATVKSSEESIPTAIPYDSSEALSPQDTWQPDFTAHTNQRSGTSIPPLYHSNAVTSLTDPQHPSCVITMKSSKDCDLANKRLPSTNDTEENFENNVPLEQVLPDNQSENLDENPYYITTVKSSEESILTATPYDSGEALSLRYHGTNVAQGRKEHVLPQLANFSTGATISNNPGLPRMLASGTPSSTNPEEGNSFQRVSDTPVHVKATSSNAPQDNWQPEFTAHTNQRSGTAIPSPYHSNAETSLTAPPHPSSVITTKSSEDSDHANIRFPNTNTPLGTEENYENDVSLEQTLPDEQYKHLDNHPTDVGTVTSNEESFNTIKPNTSGEGVCIQSHGNISIPSTITSQNREEYYENDTQEEQSEQYEYVDNQEKNIKVHEDAIYEDADSPSQFNNPAAQPKVVRDPKKNGQFQEPRRGFSLRQPSPMSDHVPPPIPPRLTEVQSESSPSSANNSPSIKKPSIRKHDMALPTKPQHTTERQNAMPQDLNIYGSIPSHRPPIPSVPPPLPPRSEVKKKKILPSLPKVIGIRKDKDKTKDKKTKSGKEKKSKEKGTLQYGNVDIVLISKQERYSSGPSGNHQAPPNVLPPPPPVHHANMLTTKSQTADDTTYDSDDGNEFIYEGDEYYTSLGMNVLEAERISMKLPASDTGKPSPTLRNDINNFLNNEYNYLGSVERISKAKSLFPTQMQSLLRGTDALYDTHNAMYGEMYASQSSISKLAGVFKKHIKELEMYKYYMMNAPQMNNILKELSQTLQQSYPQLQDDIRGSWKRLHYYFMTLERLLDSAPEKDKASVTEVVEMLRDLHLQADSGILIDSVKDAPYDLHLRAPLLLHHCFNMTGPGLKGRDYRVLLFTELIVITEPKQEQYDYQMDFRIEQTNIVSSDQETNNFSLEITFGGSKKNQVYSFRTSDEHVKKVWVKQIKRLQDEHAEKVLRERNKRYGLG